MTVHFASSPATFRHCPRTGSTSFKFWVLKNIPTAEVVMDPVNKRGSLEHLTLDEINTRWTNPGTTFAFVRNPYERLVSIFHFIGQQAKNRIDSKNNDVYPLEVDLKLLFEYKKGFAQWIKNFPQIVQSPRPYTNMALFNHPGDQNMIDCFSGVVPDLVVKLENIDKDFAKIQELVNCSVPFIHENTTSHTAYRDYYNTETQQIAYKLIERDLDTFGYTF